ncbi:MAG: methyltransferase [Saprospiraceae bacterium]|nr:methyltransferase [Saprospiraceae bacterium]
MNPKAFQFKQFTVRQGDTVHPVGTDGVLLGAWVLPGAAQRILDIGTGTGLIALMLAQKTTNARIFGLEIDPESANLARFNFENAPWQNRLSVLETAAQALLEQPVEPFDLIVSNPPFFTETTLSPDAHRQLARNTASLPPAVLLQLAETHLTKNGRFCLIVPSKNSQMHQELGACMGLYCTRITNVLARPDRVGERHLLQFERNPRFFRMDEIAIRNTDGTYSEDYQILTGDFYL